MSVLLAYLAFFVGAFLIVSLIRKRREEKHDAGDDASMPTEPVGVAIHTVIMARIGPRGGAA